MNQPSAQATRRFISLGLITVIAVYFLILVGGTVRATGAGMGCPDWPLCFGQLIPPTHESQLPANWREIYADRGYDTAPFEPVKTWIEYVNRLVGASIGLLILGFAALSWRFRRSDPWIFWCAIGALVAVAFNGWLGSKVVSSNLRPVMISLHMAGAFVVQMFLIYATVRASRHRFVAQLQNGLPNWFRHLLLATMLTMVIQIYLGVQIRESVDLISRAATDVQREQWIELIPWIFYVHRSWSWVILGLAALLIYKVFASPLRRSVIGVSVAAMIGLVIFEMILGGALNHLGFPAVAQPVHLLVAHLIFGALWFMWCLLSVSRDTASFSGPGGMVSRGPAHSSNRNSYV
jgi:cytochrome c oxidase assembly protein subunit 15